MPRLMVASGDIAKLRAVIAFGYREVKRLSGGVKSGLFSPVFAYASHVEFTAPFTAPIRVTFAPC